MPKLTQPGRYRGYVTAHAVKGQQNGTIVFEGQCELLRYWNNVEKREITLPEPIHARAFLTLVKKDGAHVDAHINNLKDCYGWDGISLKALQAVDTTKTEVSFDCRENDGENKADYPVQIAFINPGFKKVEATPDAALDALDAIFAGGKKAATGETPEAF
jgi:hypothetical protein